MTGNVVIVAANGRIASRVIRSLAESGHHPVAVVRDVDKAASTLIDSDGEQLCDELISAELTDGATLEAAFADADVAFLAVGSSPQQVQVEKNVIDAATAASLPHLVKLSAAYASADATASALRVHAEIEAHLVASGVEHTLISPSTFMEIALLGASSIQNTDGWMGAAADGVNALVDSRDVVDSVVAVIDDATLRGTTHVLTGPRAWSWRDVAQEMTMLMGRPISYRPVPVQVRRRQLEGSGLDPWRVELLLGIDELNRANLYREPTSTVSELTGHPPRSLPDFLDRHRHLLDPIDRAL